MPFLAENTDDEDEVLLAQAEQLGNFVPFVGGPQYGHLLLPLLENLSTVEETVVRDKAVESLCKVGSQLPDASMCEHFMPLVRVSSGARMLPAGARERMPAALGAAGFTGHAAVGQPLKTCMHPVLAAPWHGRVVHIPGLCSGPVCHSVPPGHASAQGGAAPAFHVPVQGRDPHG